MQYEQLRGDYGEFIFRGYNARYAYSERSTSEKLLEVEYHFEIPGLAKFNPKWKFQVAEGISTVDGVTEELDRLIFELGMVELVSYWKVTCSPKICVEAGSLTDEKTDFWKKLYWNGLGEFFYVNNISPNYDDFVLISSTVTPNLPGSSPESVKDRKVRTRKEKLRGNIIPVGGGKDSAVSLELLRNDDNLAYIINPRGASANTVTAGGYGDDQKCYAYRTIDNELLRLNSEGFLNGHTPFSAIVAFSSLIVALLYRRKYVVLSNESSANESTVVGESVNHQYSKSYEFESDFTEYVTQNHLSEANYFSFLRPLSEYQIAALFTEYCEVYRPIFRSCNAGSKLDIWCCKCPKCLFVFIIMSPFIKPPELKAIFGKDLLDDQELLTYFRELTGMEENKPFECVGSRDEICQALAITIRRLACYPKREGHGLPYLLQYFKDSELYSLYAERKNPYNEFWDETNALPVKFSRTLKKALKRIPKL